MKDELSKTPVLALYDPNRETTVSADASSCGLGAVLRQSTNGSLRPVAYASRAMTQTEQRYSPIEKEALATTWSLERFNDYLYGMSFHVETDHKPLVSLLSSKKNLDELSPRIQRFRMRLIRYMYAIAHVPGKSLVTADALSRTPPERPLTEAEELLTDEVTAQANRRCQLTRHPMDFGERRYTEKQKPRMVDGRGCEGSGGEAGSMEDDRRLYRQRGATTHQLKAPIWPEEEGSQEGGLQST